MRKGWKLLAFLIAAVGPTSMGCGGGGGGGGGHNTESNVAALSSAGAAEMDSQPNCGSAISLPSDLQPVWTETEQCTVLSAESPRVIFSPTVICPRSGEAHCLADVPFFPCSDDPSQTCGAIGRFVPSCGAIELPDQYAGAAAHEMIHYLLKANGHPDWAQHTGPEWVCQ